MVSFMVLHHDLHSSSVKSYTRHAGTDCITPFVPRQMRSLCTRHGSTIDSQREYAHLRLLWKLDALWLAHWTSFILGRRTGQASPRDPGFRQFCCRQYATDLLLQAPIPPLTQEQEDIILCTFCKLKEVSRVLCWRKFCLSLYTSRCKYPVHYFT